jgi:hypothetical protein
VRVFLVGLFGITILTIIERRKNTNSKNNNSKTIQIFEGSKTEFRTATICPITLEKEGTVIVIV